MLKILFSITKMIRLTPLSRCRSVRLSMGTLMAEVLSMTPNHWSIIPALRRAIIIWATAQTRACRDTATPSLQVHTKLMETRGKAQA